MKPKVLVTETVAIPDWTKDVLDVEYNPELWADMAAFQDRIAFCDALVVRLRTLVTADLLGKAGRLKVVGTLGVGLDKIDVKDATRRAIRVVHTPSANSNAVAEYCLGHILSSARKFHFANTSTHEGKWDRFNCMGREMRELTIGIVGYGHTGRRLHELTKVFGCRVLIASRHLKDHEVNDADLVSRERLFREADVISLHIEGGTANRGTINADLLSSMKDDVIFINAARGDLCDEDALEREVLQRRNAMFVLDVRNTEPPADQKFLQIPNVILSPHTAAFSHHAQKLVAETVFRDVAACLSGETPKWPAN